MAINSKLFGQSTKVGALWSGQGSLQLAAGFPNAKVKLVKTEGKSYPYSLVISYESGKTWHLANMFADKENKSMISGNIDFKNGSGMFIKVVKANPAYSKGENSPTSIIYGTPFVVVEEKVETTNTQPQVETQTEEEPF